MVNRLISDLAVGIPALDTRMEILLTAVSISTQTDITDILALYNALTATMTNKTIDGDLNTILDINETQQNVSVGASGTVLTSVGVGSPPTYQTPITPKFFFSAGFILLSSGTSVFFGYLMFENVYTTTEAERSVEVFTAFDVTRITARVTTNGRSGVQLYGLRDDASTVSSISIPASTTGALDSGALSDSVASGSLCNSVIDLTSAGTGTSTVPVVLIECEPT